MDNYISASGIDEFTVAMKKLFSTFLFSLILISFAVSFVFARDWTSIDNFESRNLGDLDGQKGWTVTNYDENSKNTVRVSAENPAEGTKSVEIINKDSIAISRGITPMQAGVFQLRMRHNKSGLFYFYALTSDVGGQLLWSIQLTESSGILLEQGDKQVTLLPEYNAGQWYLFTIDFDNNIGHIGENGIFKIKIDDGNYGEYQYVNSESQIFDFAQIVFGSESKEMAISAFDDIGALGVKNSLSLPDSTRVTALSGDMSYFLRIGKAEKSYSSCQATLSVSTAVIQPSWAEVGIFKRQTLSDGNVSFTKLGIADVSDIFSSTGEKKFYIDLSGAAEGDDLWIGMGSQASVPFQVKGTSSSLGAEDLQAIPSPLSLIDEDSSTSPISKMFIPSWATVGCNE